MNFASIFNNQVFMLVFGAIIALFVTILFEILKNYLSYKLNQKENKKQSLVNFAFEVNDILNEYVTTIHCENTVDLKKHVSNTLEYSRQAQYLFSKHLIFFKYSFGLKRMSFVVRILSNKLETLSQTIDSENFNKVLFDLKELRFIINNYFLKVIYYKTIKRLNKENIKFLNNRVQEYISSSNKVDKIDEKVNGILKSHDYNEIELYELYQE